MFTTREFRYKRPAACGNQNTLGTVGSSVDYNAIGAADTGSAINDGNAIAAKQIVIDAVEA